MHSQYRLLQCASFILSIASASPVGRSGLSQEIISTIGDTLTGDSQHSTNSSPNGPISPFQMFSSASRVRSINKNLPPGHPTEGSSFQQSAVHPGSKDGDVVGVVHDSPRAPVRIPNKTISKSRLTQHPRPISPNSSHWLPASRLPIQKLRMECLRPGFQEYPNRS